MPSFSHALAVALACWSCSVESGLVTWPCAPSEICEEEPALMVPCFSEHSAQLAEALSGGVAAHALVLRDHDRLAAPLPPSGATAPRISPAPRG